MRVRLLAACLAALSCATAHANRPLNTDTADVTERGTCQFEPYGGQERVSGETSISLGFAQLSCGIGLRTQFGLSAARASSAGEHADGLALSGKSELISLEDGRFGISVGYGLGWSRPSNDSWHQDAQAVYLIASRRLAEPVMVHANLGHSRTRLGEGNSTTWGAAVEWNFAPRWTFTAESFGNDRGNPWGSLGLLYEVTKGFTVNSSLGTRFGGRSNTLWTAGFNFEF